MRRLLILLFLLPMMLYASNDGVEAVLDKAVAKLKADSGVQMEFEYSVYDADASLLFREKGSLLIDADKAVAGKECFSLLLEQLKIWCNGTVQWNYTGQTNEIYITDAESDEAQNLSPLYIMQLYKNGYRGSLKENVGANVITLLPIDNNGEFDKVQVTIDKESLQPVRIALSMNGNGSTEIVVKSYKAGCLFNSKQFVCPVNEFPDAEVVDMR
ncbi:MAG: outer membrane lipoprotein carrier protein LolA [Bacteroidaceae bacterium]|nr:outer membrane lipoprotein carrier protein LolA [Bacteroidaceae bacterium]